jgi:hypothetical protein
MFFILVLVLMYPCLWAQQGTTVYDTVVTRSRFSYSWAFRYAPEFFDVEVHSSYLAPWGFFSTTEYDNEAGWDGLGVVYRAEWKYFVLDLAPSLDIWHTHGGKSTTTADFSVSVQPLLKLPLVDKKFLLSLLAGPEIKLRGNFGMYLNGGLDIGFKVTDHHVLFLGGLFGIDITGPPMYDNTSSRYKDAWGANNSYNTQGATKFQITLGIKTLQLEDVFYLNGKEVNRRRR